MTTMSGQIQPIITALWLILILQTMIISCSKSDTETIDDGPHLARAVRGYLGHPAPLQAPTPGNVSKACQWDLYQLLNITNSKFKNGLKALDAFGKPGAGFMEGNFAWLGNYYECMSLEGFNYCLADIQIDNITIISEALQIVIHWGICPPASCSGEDVMNALQDLLGLLDERWVSFKTVSAAAVTCSKSPPIPYSDGVIFTVILLSVIGILMVGGSLYDEYLKLTAKKSAELSVQMEDGVDVPLLDQEISQTTSNVHSQEAPQGLLAKFLLCFAATRNLSKLLDTQQKDTSISSLNGIRFISMMWVIMDHTFEYALLMGTTENPVYYLDLNNQDVSFQILANGFYPVDTFFVLSGCLISYLTLSRMKEMKSAKAWGWFYFHRYWRLTPVLIITILVWTYIQPFAGEGPVWQTTTPRPLCQKYWWTNLLYINNFYPQDFNDQCMKWTWYLADDMQFFIITPLLLVPLYYTPILGWIGLIALSVVSMVVIGVLYTVFNLPVNIVDRLLGIQHARYALDQSSLVFGKPYCRIAPYLVGIGLGYIMYKTGKRKVKMSFLLALAGWVLATGLAMSVVYGLYPAYQPGYTMTKAAVVVYAAVNHFAWAIAIAWVIYACKYGYGGWINGFLSWSGWIPLSRLTYTAYMFHPIIVLNFYSNIGDSIYLSKHLLAFNFAGILAFAYFIALFAALAVEYPFVNLEKLFMPKNLKVK